MIKGRDFYAMYNENNGLWSKDQDDVIKTIDNDIKKFCKEHKDEDIAYRPQLMVDAESGMIDRWNKFVTKQLRDNYNPLDLKPVFSNSEMKREYYSTHRLNYPLMKMDTPAYDELMDKFYEPEERKKLEWAVGSIIYGDSVWIQKFIVIVGEPGTGKGSFFKILRQLFPGYIATINAKAIGDAKAQFSLEPLRNDPLLAIEDDSNLSKITDNTRLNSLVSHEPMTVNEKFKGQYTMAFHSFVFLGSNADVKITDANSGITRRLIDVTTSGRKFKFEKYDELMNKIKNELPGIAWKCRDVYIHNKRKYDDYLPVRALRATNLIYSFMEETLPEIEKEDGIRFYDLWNMYNRYCDLGGITFKHNRNELRNELRPYFKEYYASYEYEPGKMANGYFKGFRYEKLGIFKEQPEPVVMEEKPEEDIDIPEWLQFKEQHSKFDDEFADCIAQYTKEDESPLKYWDDVKTTLKDIDTTKLHYMLCPAALICIDLDKKNEKGEKDRLLNQKAAAAFPPTYGEYSKSGAGIHLYYLYDGDVDELSMIYAPDIEIKKLTGKSALRRKLIACNDNDICHIPADFLPTKGDKKMIDTEVLLNEKALRTLIIRAIHKEYHSYTTGNVSFILKKLNESYDTGLSYDVRDLRQSVYTFCCKASNQKKKCLEMFSEMHFCSDDRLEKETPAVVEEKEDKPLVFFDFEVFTNVIILCWERDDNDETIAWVNPTPDDILSLLKYNLAGFNNKGYDNLIALAIIKGYDIDSIYDLSQKIINHEPTYGLNDAKGLSYTDVLCFSNKKQSLKKWEIEMGISHVELGLPWDKPVPDELIPKVIRYCKWDVKSTKKLFHYLEDDWIARLVLSELSGLSVNESTNAHTQQYVFGDDRHPQTEFNYPDLSLEFPGYKFYIDEVTGKCKSTYNGKEVNEGGKVEATVGVHFNVKTFDVTSMHPSTIIAVNLFGDKYTGRFAELVYTRVDIKHGNEESARSRCGGRIGEIQDKLGISIKQLNKSLKVPINAVYGQTFSKYKNRFRDERNVDNVVAKRGALFMFNLEQMVKDEGYTIAHIKTDSIKIPNADENIENKILELGKKYGYSFETESEYAIMCLVNESTYIAREKDGTWTATGAQFKVPFVFKTLFSHEPLIFDDYCETKSVNKGDIYIDKRHDIDIDKESLYDRLCSKAKRLKTKIASGDNSVKDEYESLQHEIDILYNEIEQTHERIFVGRVGRFTPMKAESGAGELVCYRDGKYVSVAGSTGYLWLESEYVKQNGLENAIDISYYRKLADEAVEAIEKYIPFENFISNEEVPF